MLHYRLVFLKAPEGPVTGVEEIDARDDVEAVHVAGERTGPDMIEVWCEKRRVKRFAAAAPAEPSFAFSFAR